MKLMVQPQSSFWTELFDFVKENTVPFGIFALLWKAIDKIGAHFAQRRKDELRELIKEEVSPELDKINGKIDDLHGMIYDLKKR